MAENNISELGSAVVAADRAATAAMYAYDAVCKEPVVLEARQRRSLLGLGRNLAGDPNAADLDRMAVELILLFIGKGGMIPFDDRLNGVFALGQEALARAAPPPSKRMASADDLELCLAIDAAALVRVAIELALGAANLDIARELAEQGDADADRAIATRLAMDIHAPVGVAFGATRIASGSSWLGIVLPHTAVGAAEDGDGALAPAVIGMADIASDAADLAAEAADAYEAACEAMLS